MSKYHIRAEAFDAKGVMTSQRLGAYSEEVLAEWVKAALAKGRRIRVTCEDHQATIDRLVRTVQEGPLT